MKCGVEESFIELGRVWQAPMYEITLNFNQCNKSENLTIVQKFLITLIDSSLCTTQLCSFFSTFVNGFSLASLMNHLLLLSQVLLLINFVNQECFLYSITWSLMRLVMMQRRKFLTEHIYYQEKVVSSWYVISFDHLCFL